MRSSDKTPLLSCLLEGPGGSGKSALAATRALASEFPFVKVLGPETLVGYAEQAKASQITRVRGGRAGGRAARRLRCWGLQGLLLRGLLLLLLLLLLLPGPWPGD